MKKRYRKMERKVNGKIREVGEGGTCPPKNVPLVSRVLA